MRFALFRRRQASVVTAVAGVPVHGREKDADGVMLHLALEGEAPIDLFVPKRLAPELRDYLRKVTDALDHWDKVDRLKREATPRPPGVTTTRVNYRDGQPVRWEKNFDYGSWG
jgi:hypothetical protein